MSNEEKIIVMLEKMNNRFDTLEQDMKSLEQDVTFIRQTVAKTENDHGKRLNAIHDGYVTNLEKTLEISDRLYGIEEKVDRHDIEIALLKKSAVN